MKEVEIVWRVDDGFVNKGTHTTKVDIEDFDGMDPDEIEDEIYDIVSEEFNQKVSSSVDDITGVVAAICAALDDGEE